MPNESTEKGFIKSRSRIPQLACNLHAHKNKKDLQ
jgi:hypothetical protein